MTRKETAMTGQLLTAEELAERLAVSPRTVIEWARAGRIPEIRASRRIRRFDYADVLAALKASPGAERDAASGEGVPT